MMHMPSLACGTLALALWLGGSGAVLAQGVRIAPVVVDVASARQPGVVTMTNDAATPLTFQGQALRWRQEDGRDVFEPTDDLVIVPALAEIAPGQSQIFRVMLRQPAAAPVERTYRMVLEDITVQTAPTLTVHFRYTHNLPVLFAPAGKVVPQVRWKPCEPPADKPGMGCIRVLNDGNRRLKLRRIQLEGSGWEHTVDLPQGVNVLAGASREWLFPRGGAARPAPERVTVEASDVAGVQVLAGGF